MIFQSFKEFTKNLKRLSLTGKASVLGVALLTGIALLLRASYKIGGNQPTFILWRLFWCILIFLIMALVLRKFLGKK